MFLKISKVCDGNLRDCPTGKLLINRRPHPLMCKIYSLVYEEGGYCWIIDGIRSNERLCLLSSSEGVNNLLAIGPEIGQC